MNEFVKRVLSGVLYVVIIWSATIYSQISYTVLFVILGLFVFSKCGC